MATITRVKNKKGVKWRAQVFVKGARESARFDTKPEAAEWAHEREIVLRKGKALVTGKTLADAFDRYARELPAERKGRRWDAVRLEKFKRDPIADVQAAMLSLEHGEQYIARALESGLATSTVIREFSLLKPVVRKMVRWKWIAEYPWAQLEMPADTKRRSKLYTFEEIALIRKHSGLDSGAPGSMFEVGVAFIVATETGMRLNEICSLESSWWDQPGRFIALPSTITKTGEARNVPLSTVASEHLSMLTPGPKGNLFSVNAQTASSLFRRIRKRAGIHDATFHDTRHYAVTKLSKKFDVLSLARVIGHSDIRELMTYYEADAAELATMLD